MCIRDSLLPKTNAIEAYYFTLKNGGNLCRDCNVNSVSERLQAQIELGCIEPMDIPSDPTEQHPISTHTHSVDLINNYVDAKGVRYWILLQYAKPIAHPQCLCEAYLQFGKDIVAPSLLITDSYFLTPNLTKYNISTCTSIVSLPLGFTLYCFLELSLIHI